MEPQDNQKDNQKDYQEQDESQSSSFQTDADQDRATEEAINKFLELFEDVSSQIAKQISDEYFQKTPLHELLAYDLDEEGLEEMSLDFEINVLEKFFTEDMIDYIDADELVSIIEELNEIAISGDNLEGLVRKMEGKFKDSIGGTEDTDEGKDENESLTIYDLYISRTMFEKYYYIEDELKMFELSANISGKTTLKDYADKIRDAIYKVEWEEVQALFTELRNQE